MAAIGQASLSLQWLSRHLQGYIQAYLQPDTLPPGLVSLVYPSVYHPSLDVEIVGAGCMGRCGEEVPAGSGPVAERGLSSLAGGAGKSEQPAPAGG